MSPILRPHIYAVSFFCCVICFNSCGSDGVESATHSSTAEVGDKNVLELISGSSRRIEDLESLLNEGNSTNSLSVQGADSANSLNSIANSIPKATSFSKNENGETNAAYQRTEAEKALQNLEVSALEHQKSIEELRKINTHKDKTIASLSAINDELLSEIRRIKQDYNQDLTHGSLRVASGDTNVNDLRSEVKNLKNSLFLKSNEIKDLRVRNDSLEKRISSLENLPSQSVVLANPPEGFPDVSSSDYSRGKQSLTDSCSIMFDAVVTSYNGKSKEAFYTEFFVLNQSLNSLLSSNGIKIENYSGVENFAELWAQSRKNSFLYPDLQKRIRSILLDQVDKGSGKRVRTDINGGALVENLSIDKYFIIGCAALGKVGVTWNVPINLESGLNKVSLTLANASWSE